MQIQLEKLTSPAIKNLLQNGWTSVVFSCGAVEQHGPHLPLFMDAEHGTALAMAVAQKIGKAMVAPTIRVGCSDHHMAFAGTLTLRKSTFQAVVTDYVSSLVKHGFQRIIILPTHGGNFGPIKEMLPDLSAAFPNTTIKAYTDIYRTLVVWRETVQQLTGLGNRVVGHADIAETSILLSTHPELIDMSLAEVGFLGELVPEIMEKLFTQGIHAIAPNGILGDARGATAEMGKVLIDALAEDVIKSTNI